MCRDQIAVLRHRTQKASRFKRNRLAARVGAGDDHRVASAAQCDVYRNDHSRIDERVARTHKTERMVVVHLRFHGLLVQRQPGLGQQHIQLQHRSVAKRKHRLQCRSLSGKCCQNAFDLSLFQIAQLQDLGIGLHHGRRLHKQRGTAGRNVVDDAAHLAAVLRFHGHDKAPVAQRNHGVLQIS